eukprot:scaffold105391_cov65-Phaeocystis_antarctica.AAC.1
MHAPKRAPSYGYMLCTRYVYVRRGATRECAQTKIADFLSTAAVWCVPFCLDCSVPSVYSINYKRNNNKKSLHLRNSYVKFTLKERLTSIQKALGPWWTSQTPPLKKGENCPEINSHTKRSPVVRLNLHTLVPTPTDTRSKSLRVISVLVISVEFDWDALQQHPKLFGAVALCVGDKHAAGLTVRGVVEGHGNILGLGPPQVDLVNLAHVPHAH